MDVVKTALLDLFLAATKRIKHLAAEEILDRRRRRQVEDALVGH
jgi:hypothetical protein